MGFRPPPRNYSIRWAEDHPLHGLEVEARGLRLGKMLDLAEMYVDSGINRKNDDDDLTIEDINLMKGMFRMLVGNDDVCPVGTPGYRPGLIMRWNREDDDGDPLPVSMAGIRELELSEFQGIMEAYLESGGVKLEDPLSDGSKNGEQSPELSALTELESLSQQN